MLYFAFILSRLCDLSSNLHLLAQPSLPLISAVLPRASSHQHIRLGVAVSRPQSGCAPTLWRRQANHCRHRRINHKLKIRFSGVPAEPTLNAFLCHCGRSGTPAEQSTTWKSLGREKERGGAQKQRVILLFHEK